MTRGNTVRKRNNSTAKMRVTSSYNTVLQKLKNIEGIKNNRLKIILETIVNNHLN